MSKSRRCLSEEPESMYGGLKSIEAMLCVRMREHERVCISGQLYRCSDQKICHIPPSVMVFKGPQECSCLCIPESYGPVTRA